MKIVRHTALCTLFQSAGVGARFATMLAAALAITPISAMAAAIVSGNPQAVSVDAQNSSVAEILAALGRDFNVHYRSSADLKTEITGTYEGSLRRVVTRILEGYNFIMKSSPGGIEVTVLGRRNAPAMSGVTITAKGTPTPQAVPKTAAAPSRVAQQPQAAPSGTAPATAAPAPAIKVAEGPMPVPTPTASGKSLPVPTPNTSVLVAPPVPAPGAAAGAVPEARPSKMAPPRPPQLGSAPANSPIPPGSATHAPGKN